MSGRSASRSRSSRGSDPQSTPRRFSSRALTRRRTFLSLRDAISDVVESVITAYRAVIRAHRAISIARESLSRSEEQLEVNRSLIRAGRMAAREIVQSEAEIANRRLALVESENGLISANAALLSVLDVDDATSVRTSTALPSVKPPVGLELEQSIESALIHRSDYRRALLNREEATIRLAIAKDERQWDLMLNADVSQGRNGERGVSTGLALVIPLGDRQPRLGVLRARNALRDAEIEIVELRQSIRIAVRQAVHDVEVGFRRVELARKAREFAEQQVGVEQEKLAQGLTSTFQLSAIENDLVSAKTRELDATVSYLNALTLLDRTLGTTLHTWGIDAGAFESERAPTVSDPALRTDSRSSWAASNAAVAARGDSIPRAQAGPPGGGTSVSPNGDREAATAHEQIGTVTGAESFVPETAAKRRSLLLSLRDISHALAIDRAPVSETDAEPAGAPGERSWGYEFIRLE